MNTTTLEFNLAMNKKSVEMAQEKFDNDTKRFDAQHLLDDDYREIDNQKSKDYVMITEVSEKITRFMNWEEFEFVDDWNTIQPVISKITKEWTDTAELLYDYHFIDIYNCINVYEALPKVERCIDELHKRERSVYGCVYEITIENVSRFPELAKAIDNQQVHHMEQYTPASVVNVLEKY